MPEANEITAYAFFQRLCKLPFIKAIYLFGSRAQGNNDDYSDYDLAIVCPDASRTQWEEVAAILENAAFLNKVEAVRYDTLEENLFKRQIDTYKQVLYARD